MGKGSGCIGSKDVPVRYEVRNAGDIEGDAAHRDNNAPGSAPAEGSPQIASGSALPKGWASAVDSSTGRTYFVDEINKRSQWEDPRSGRYEMPTGSASSSNQPVSTSQPLPPNWEERVDPASGRPYFVNLLTKYVTWDNPRQQLMMQAGGESHDQAFPVQDIQLVAYPPPSFYPGYQIQSPDYHPTTQRPQHTPPPPPPFLSPSQVGPYTTTGYGYAPSLGPGGYYLQQPSSSHYHPQQQQQQQQQQQPLPGYVPCSVQQQQQLPHGPPLYAPQAPPPPPPLYHHHHHHHPPGGAGASSAQHAHNVPPPASVAGGAAGGLAAAALAGVANLAIGSPRRRRRRRRRWQWGFGHGGGLSHGQYGPGRYGYGYGGGYYGGHHYYHGGYEEEAHYHHSSSNSSSSSDSDMDAVGIAVGAGLGIGLLSDNDLGIIPASSFSGTSGGGAEEEVDADADTDDAIAIAVAMYGGAGPRDLPGDGGGGGGGGGGVDGWGAGAGGGTVGTQGRGQPWKGRHAKGPPPSLLNKILLPWSNSKKQGSGKGLLFWSPPPPAAAAAAAEQWQWLCVRLGWRAWQQEVLVAMLVWVVGALAWAAPGLGKACARRASLWLQRRGCPWALRQHVHRLLLSRGGRGGGGQQHQHHQQWRRRPWPWRKARSSIAVSNVITIIALDMAEAVFLGPWLALHLVLAEVLAIAMNAATCLLWRLAALYYAYVHVHPPARLQLLHRRFESALPPLEREITIVTQASMDRLPAIEAMARAWDGPISVALFLDFPLNCDDDDDDGGHGKHAQAPNAGTVAAAAATAKEKEEEALEAIAALHARVEALGRCRLDMVLAVDADGDAHTHAHAHDATTTAKGGRAGALSRYPVNALRNAALDAARTELVLLLDADFVPSRGLHAALTADADTWRSLNFRAVGCRHLLVLPAFEIAGGSSSTSSSHKRTGTHGRSLQGGMEEEKEDNLNTKKKQRSEEANSSSSSSVSRLGGCSEEEEGQAEEEKEEEEEASNSIPGSMAELATAWATGVATAFHCAHFPQGHAPTDYPRFLRRGWDGGGGGGGGSACSSSSSSHVSNKNNNAGQKEEKKKSLDTYPVNYREFYEPYFIAAKSQLPRYNDSFRGYGLNKIAHVYECAARAMSFHVLHGHFVAALEHPHSPAWNVMYGQAKDPFQQLQVRGLYRQFKASLLRRRRSWWVVLGADRPTTEKSRSTWNDQTLQHMPLGA